MGCFIVRGSFYGGVSSIVFRVSWETGIRDMGLCVCFLVGVV